MMIAVTETTPTLIHAVHFEAGTRTVWARFGRVSGSGTLTLRIRLAGDDTDLATMSNATAAMVEDEEDLVVAADAMYEVYAEITSGIGLAEVDAEGSSGEGDPYAAALTPFGGSMQLVYSMEGAMQNLYTFTGSVAVDP